MSSRPTRILVVDDSVVARRVISDVLSEEGDLEVVGTAPNGRIALTKIPRLQPDLVTLDIEMPELDGLETLAAIRATSPKLPVIMISNHTRHGAAVTIEALFLGASDYVTKSIRITSPEEAKQHLRMQLLPKIRALAPPGTVARDRERRRAATPPVARSRSRSPVEIVVIGASTGGPNALAAVLAGLPADFPAPVLIVQHMPENFTTFLAQRLDGVGPLSVREALAGDRIAAGDVRVARGNFHLEVHATAAGVEIVTTEGPLVNSCRPSADVLFESAVSHYGASVLAVMLTGMGQDGLVGCRRIREAGGQIIAQDKATSVVWGMPGQVAEAGLADVVLPISQIGAEIVRRVGSART